MSKLMRKVKICCLVKSIIKARGCKERLNEKKLFLKLVEWDRQAFRDKMASVLREDLHVDVSRAKVRKFVTNSEVSG